MGVTAQEKVAEDEIVRSWERDSAEIRSFFALAEVNNSHHLYNVTCEEFTIRRRGEGLFISGNNTGIFHVYLVRLLDGSIKMAVAPVSRNTLFEIKDLQEFVRAVVEAGRDPEAPKLVVAEFADAVGGAPGERLRRNIWDGLAEFLGSGFNLIAAEDKNAIAIIR